MPEIDVISEPSLRATRLAQGMMLFAVLLAALFAMAGCVPLSWLRPLGDLVRRPGDVTPERYTRYLHVCWTFALGCLLLGWAARRGRLPLARFLDQLLRDIRACVSRQHSVRAPRLLRKESGARGLRRADIVLLALVILVGIAVRLAFLHRPVAYDEAYSFVNFARRPWYEAVSDYNSTNNHLFNTLLMHWSYRIWGQQEWALRLGPCVFGVLLLLCCYLWGNSRLGRGPALLTTALAAASPLLISYSVNARGYIYVAACAVLLDWLLEELHQGRPRPALRWCGAWLATVVGLWAMPIMVYPLAGIVGWFVLVPLIEPVTRFRPPGVTIAARAAARWPGADRSDAPVSSTLEHAALGPGHPVGCRARLRRMLLFLGLAALATMALYAPAYIFRGVLAFQHPFVLPVGFGEVLRTTPTAWWDAVGWWTAGAIPKSIWLAAFVVGTASLIRQRDRLLMLGFPFVATAGMMLAQQVAPPPRIFLVLAPWFYLLTAQGLAVAAQWVLRSPWASRLITVGILMAAGWYAALNPLLFNAPDRRLYADVEDVVLSVGRERNRRPDEPIRLIVPLPCDLPAIYYLLQHDTPIPVNGVPLPEETVWLVSPVGHSPDDTLRAGNVNLAGWSNRLSPWRKQQDFQQLTLWVSTNLAKH